MKVEPVLMKRKYFGHDGKDGNITLHQIGSLYRISQWSPSSSFDIDEDFYTDPMEAMNAYQELLN